jgi:hypothetical protein
MMLAPLREARAMGYRSGILQSSIGRFVMIVLSEDVVKLAQSILLTWLIDASIVVGGMALMIRVAFPEIEAWIESTKGHADV